jgi:hypothetical protein
MIAEGATFLAARLNARPMGLHAPAQRAVAGRWPAGCRRAYSSAVAQE